MRRIEHVTINKILESHIFNREEAMIIRSRFSSPDPRNSSLDPRNSKSSRRIYE